MASQVTHITYAKVVKEKFLTGKHIDEAKFYVGNIFPDIRYLGDITREASHIKNPTVGSLLKIENSFELGMYCHALIDRKREEALMKLGFYDVIAKDDLIPYAIKLIEDQVNYPRTKNLPEVIGYLDSVFEEEVKLVPKDTVVKWHKLTSEYFSQSPTRQTIARFVEGLSIDKKIINSVLQLMDKVKENKKAMRLIETTEENLF